MLTDGDFAVAKSIGEPSRNHGRQTFMLANVRFVDAWHGGVADFVGNDAKQVGFKRLRVEVNDAAAKIRHSFAQFFGRRALDFDRPPFAIELEA
jgi:hypothetical protein